MLTDGAAMISATDTYAVLTEVCPRKFVRDRVNAYIPTVPRYSLGIDIGSDNCDVTIGRSAAIAVELGLTADDEKLHNISVQSLPPLPYEVDTSMVRDAQEEAVEGTLKWIIGVIGVAGAAMRMDWDCA